MRSLEHSFTTPQSTVQRDIRTIVALQLAVLSVSSVNTNLGTQEETNVGMLGEYSLYGISSPDMSAYYLTILSQKPHFLLTEKPLSSTYN